MGTPVLCWRLNVTSLSCHLSQVWIDYIGDTVTWLMQFPISIALAFVTKMSEKYKSTLSSAIQAQNWQKALSIEDILSVIRILEKVELLTYNVTSDSLIVAYIQFILMLIELQKELRQELQCLLV
jgi:hypothetical protein